MRLVHQWLENPLITDDSICNIAIFERSIQFYEIVKELRQQCETDDGGFTLSSDMKRINLSKYVNLVIGFPFIDHNPRRVITALYKQLNEAIIENERLEQIQVLLDQLTLELTKIGQESAAELEEIEAPTWQEVFKFYNLRFRSDYPRPEEALCDYFRVMRKYCGHTIFVLINALGFLESDGLRMLFSQANYEEFYLLFIENRVNESCQSIASRTLIVDQDLCEIVINHV